MPTLFPGVGKMVSIRARSARHCDIGQSGDDIAGSRAVPDRQRGDSKDDEAEPVQIGFPNRLAI